MDRKRFRGTKIPRLIGALLVIVAISTLAYGAKNHRSPGTDNHELKTTTDKLASIKKEIETRRKKMRELEKVEGNYLARLESLETNITASKKYLTMLALRVDSAETTIVRLNDSVISSQSMLVDRQIVMRQRLRTAYMTGTPSPLMALFMAKSPLDVVHRVRYLEGIHRYDRDLLLKIDQAKAIFNNKKSSFERVRARLARLLAETMSEQKMLMQEEASRKKLLEDVRFKKRSNQSLIADLEAAQRELNEVIRLLEQKKPRIQGKTVASGATAFERQKGRMPWPIKGEVTARFGRVVHPLYQTITMNNGIDLRVREGGEVRCVAGGTVIYTGSMRGLGKIVIIGHGGNYLTIYARLETIDIAAGASAAAGASVGRIGSAGQLHFEIRHSTESFDPLPWLGKR